MGILAQAGAVPSSRSPVRSGKVIFVAMAPKKTEERKERHSGDPKSSVNPPAKKDGAGGKYTVGKVTDQSGPAVLDKGDPNYDSDGDHPGVEKLPAAERKRLKKEAK